ncbi:Receptor like protein 22 [Linum perenne]
MIMGGLDDAMAMFNLQHLQVLDLSFNNFNTTVPTGIGNLTYLRYLNLSSAGFYGQIPAAISGLTKLVGLDLSMLYFPGAPTMKLENPNLLELVKNLAQLVDLRLDGVNISAQGNQWCQALASSVKNLEALSMSNCFLSGRIDSSLSKLQSLSVIRLDSNEFSSPIPDFFAEFRNLTVLRLSSCLLNGEFPETIFQVPSLELLDLSNNGLLHGVLPDFPQNHSMQTLLLSGTNFSGMLPASMGNLGKLSRIELEGCNFNGPVPKSMEDLTQLVYVDLASNHFTGPIPSLGLSKNLVHLDLSYNQLAGDISAQWESFQELVFVDLRDNKLSGNIPDRFQESCSLETLDLSKNQLEGSFPKSLSNCTSLKVLDLGNNRLSDGFPCLLESKANLRVLILRNNNFHGGLGCPHIPGNWRKLQIIDLAFNKFSGQVNSRFLTTWEAMMGVRNRMEDHIQFEPFQFTQLYYQDSTTVTTKGLQLEFLKILTVFTSIDFSSNNFEGSIPETLGKFSALYVLNFSNNAFTGQIPTVLGNLSQLESLDLSNNELSGQIPQELARLTFLSALNLSNNHLAGSIPTGSQLQTFDNSSFGGNPGLCGIPLSRYCIPQPVSAVSLGKSGAGIQWTLLSIEFGGVFGLAAVILPAMLWPRFQNWYWPRIDSLIVRLFPRLYVKDRNRHLRQRRRRGRRSSR